MLKSLLHFKYALTYFNWHDAYYPKLGLTVRKYKDYMQKTNAPQHMPFIRGMHPNSQRY